MAYSAKHLKESLEQGTDMQDIERDDERVETHISGVRNLSEEAREMRAAGRKLVGEGEEKADNLSDYRRLSGSVKKLKESVDAQSVDQHIIIWHFRRIKLCRNNAGIFHPRTPGILVITVIEKIITVITRLKMGYFNFPDSANYGIK